MAKFAEFLRVRLPLPERVLDPLAVRRKLGGEKSTQGTEQLFSLRLRIVACHL